MDDRRSKDLKLERLAVKWRGKVAVRARCGLMYRREIASTVARTGSKWPLKGGGERERQGQDASRRCEWPGGCLC